MSLFRDVRSGYLFCMKMGNETAEHILKNGIFEHGLIEWSQQYLSPNGIFIDIGSHMGTYSIILSPYCKKVYAFEAQKNTFEYLNVGIEANNIKNIETFNVGLGSKEDILNLIHVSDDGGGSSFVSNISEISGRSELDRESVKIFPLDTYNFTDINLIKMDVEGFELEVIKGSLKTLEINNYPPIMFEAWDNYKYIDQKIVLFEFIKSLGYNIHTLTGADNMYLASDNPKYTPPDRTKNVKPINILKEGFRNNDFVYWTENDWMSLCRHFLDEKYYHDLYKCSLYAKKMVNIPLNKSAIRRYLAKSCYFIGYLDKSKKLYEKMLTSYLCSWNIRNDLILEYSKLMERLPLSKRIPINFDIPGGYHHSSTSIVPDTSNDQSDSNESGYKLCVRNVNYVIRDDGGYNMSDPQGFVRTINYLARLENNLEVSPITQLIDISNIKKYPVNIIGMEDIRLFGENYLLAVYPEVNSSRTPQMCLGKYGEDGGVDTIIPLSLTENIQCEKNWLPFIVDGVIHVIYSLEPFRIYTIDEDTGKMDLKLERHNDEINLSDFRGSAPPIPYKDGYLFTIHQVYMSTPRKYFHRFVWMDKQFDNLKYSNLFYLQSVEIEYNLSICHHPEGLLVPYSYRDSSSVIGVLDYTVLDNMLRL